MGALTDIILVPLVLLLFSGSEYWKLLEIVYVSAAAVRMIPCAVRSQTPLVKLAASSSTSSSPEPRPLIVPPEEATVVLLVDASKLVAVFRYSSWIVRVLVPVQATPLSDVPEASEKT